MIANFKFAPRSALLFTLGPWACGVFAATARAAPASPPGPEKISYGVEAVLLVVLILSLLALLFWLLLRWSHRLDQASYLGDVYRESVEDFEYKRLATAPTERLRGGEYHREIEQDGEWLRKNERPEPPPGFYAGTAVGPPGAWPPGAFPMQATSTGTGDGRAKSPEDREAENAYWHQENEWRGKVEAEASSRYRRDLDEARLRAKERAKFATDVDLSALRGRGAEFVLEFTTVVVIIFAALILGVLGILGTEQIGTLLAAIAGYVLGRATTRGRGTAAEGPAAVKEERKDKARDKLGAER